MARSAKCKGKGCEYFRCYNGVQKHEGGYLPDFKTVEARCVHPSLYQYKGWGHIEETPGVPVVVLRECPETKESE